MSTKADNSEDIPGTKYELYPLDSPKTGTAEQNENLFGVKKGHESEKEAGALFLPIDPPHLTEEDDWTDSDEEMDLEARKTNWIGRIVINIQQAIKSASGWLRKVTRGYLLTSIVLIGYFAYFIAAMSYELGQESSLRLLVCTILGVIIATRHQVSRAAAWLFQKVYGAKSFSDQLKSRLATVRFFIRWLLYGALTAVIVYVLIDQGRKNPTNLRSLPGLFIFLLICLLFSTHPSKVNWHTIYWSVGLQFLTALITLKWAFGREMIIWIQTRLDEFLANAKEGSKLLFGETYNDHYFVFGALPIIFVTNATLTMLYYLGAMQFLIRIIGTVLHYILETSAVESMSVAAGIFLEGISAILSLRPYLPTVSKSQLFLIITSVFASLGGAYLAILSTLGVSLEYLIPAMVVSAPATFAVCKLMVPETKKVKPAHEELQLADEEQTKYANLLDAGQTGATSMLSLAGNIATVAFAFFSYISWINKTLEWFGDRVGVDHLSIELISSYLFYPLALAMGIEPEDCRNVAMLLGYRMGVNNIIAFFKLTELKINKAKFDNYMLVTNGTGPVTLNRDTMVLEYWNMTLKHGYISVMIYFSNAPPVQDRSEAIITYCLCGFSSFLSVAITIGIMYTLIPKRRRWIAKMAVPALIAGNVANCMTGCFASKF
ncbi:unnamed protein product [Lymnaea stagnalis]|uniref:Uncharacterized protein n=1 Tax=Lymnaea stagnalis TaxID=6523 RepID=A0AAV2HB03_LYMST